MLCDRYSTNTAKSQIGFINFMVYPLFSCVVKMLPEGEQTVKCLKENKGYWEGKVDYYEKELKTLIK